VRTIYLIKLPRWEKRLHVALDWTLDLIFSKDTIQYVSFRALGHSMPPAPAITDATSGAPPRKIRFERS
jgi:NADH dehydrogenase